MSNDFARSLSGQYLTFRLDEQVYGVPISSVREINRVTDITIVPKTPKFVAGVINLRGKVIPVVDLRLKFGLVKAEFSKETCIIVLDAESGQIGVIVDAVNAVVSLAQDAIEPPPLMGNLESLNFILGMGKTEDRVVILVDVVQTLGQDAFDASIELVGSGKAA